MKVTAEPKAVDDTETYTITVTREMAPPVADTVTLVSNFGSVASIEVA